MLTVPLGHICGLVQETMSWCEVRRAVAGFCCRKAGLGSEVRLPEGIDPTVYLAPGSCSCRLADRAVMQWIVSKATVLDSQCMLPWEVSTDVVH